MTTITEKMVEGGARAAFKVDWPKDNWTRFQPDDHVPTRYRNIARAALTAALSKLPPEPQWQPIETAPKDGRTILFRRAPPFSTGINLTFGFWHDGQNVPGWEATAGIGKIVPEHWPEWMHIDFLLPDDVVRWLHPDRINAR